MNTNPTVKILIVDDLDENLLALSTLLKKESREVLCAKSGREALELLLVHDVALAILDVQMPEMDGFELAELMRGTARTRSVPIIFVTAGARDAQRVFRGYEVGAVDFLFKPIEPVLLAHKVDTFVQLHVQRLECEMLNEELKQTLRMNELFVAAIGHDLRAALSTVVMGASLLDEDVRDAGARHTLSRVRTSAQRMSSMLEDLYDLARARHGGIAVEMQPVDMRTLVESIVSDLQMGVRDKRIVVRHGGAALLTMGDKKRMEQLLVNLIGNALRHGDKSVPIDVHLQIESDATTVSIHNGGSIDPALIPALFEPFKKADCRSREGLGLGLYIAKQIAQAHGGDIQVHSSAEAGTTFSVALPRTGKRHLPKN